MRFLVGTMPLDENKAMSEMLSKCGASNVIYQPFVRERKQRHWPVYNISFGRVRDFIM